MPGTLLSIFIWMVPFEPHIKPVRYVLTFLSSLGEIARSPSLVRRLESTVTVCSNKIKIQSKIN